MKVKNYNRTLKKNTIALLVLSILFIHAYGQQMPHYSQYMHNGFVLNPAIAGEEGCFIAGVDVRKQWLGFKGSPFTQTAFIHGGFGKTNGLGLVIFNDVAGAEGMLGAELAYSYYLVKNKKGLFSVGLSVKAMQYQFNQTTFAPEIQGDPALNLGVLKAIQPDAAFGMYLKRKKWFMGLGVQQLLSSLVKITSIDFLERHYFLSAGYTYKMRRKTTLEPSFLIKSIENLNVGIDLNLKAIYDKRYIIGFSYRNYDAVVLIFGLISNKFTIAYNYDLNTSRLFRYNTGSHEIFIGYKWCRHRGPGEPMYHTVPCPAYN